MFTLVIRAALNIIAQIYVIYRQPYANTPYREVINQIYPLNQNRRINTTRLLKGTIANTLKG